MIKMKRNDMIHYLRNPYGLDEHRLREVRLQVADELERLYKIEDKIKTLIEDTIVLRKYLAEKDKNEILQSLIEKNS